MVLCDGRRIRLRSRTGADAVETRRLPSCAAEGAPRLGVRRRSAREDTHWFPTCWQNGDLLSRGGKDLRLRGRPEAVPRLRDGNCWPTALTGVVEGSRASKQASVNIATRCLTAPLGG